VGAPFQDQTGVVFILFLGYGGVVASYTKISAYFGNPHFGNPTYKVRCVCVFVCFLLEGRHACMHSNDFHHPRQSPLTVGDEFGCSIANIGDLNGDGIPDLAVGACGDADAVRTAYHACMYACGSEKRKDAEGQSY
jgi:hypothetical protein